eukprot:6715324-Ditylum_brightwellii.AAC.1
MVMCVLLLNVLLMLNTIDQNEYPLAPLPLTKVQRKMINTPNVVKSQVVVPEKKQLVVHCQCPVEHQCQWQMYKDPVHHSGLPFLGDVFAKNSLMWFAAVNKGNCLKEWQGTQEFYPTPKLTH